MALVIGNGGYQNASKLTNPPNDAAAIARMFRDAGFEVVEAKTDLGNLEFKRVVREFTAVARDSDIAVLFYAGHGIEVNGTNYLIPVDAKLATDFDVEDESLALDRLVRALEPARRLRLIILDACRDNPFTRNMQRTIASRAVVNGLAKVEPATSDTLIAYATKPGFTADDGIAANSPFTAALLKNLTVPGRDVRIALGFTRDEVLKSTSGRQEPFVSGSLGGATVALVPEKKEPEPKREIAVQPSVAPPSGGADPRRDYEFAERVGTREAWDSFLTVHSPGFYADLARAQRDKLASRRCPGSAAGAAGPARRVKSAGREARRRRTSQCCRHPIADQRPAAASSARREEAGRISPYCRRRVPSGAEAGAEIEASLISLSSLATCRPNSAGSAAMPARRWQLVAEMARGFERFQSARRQEAGYQGRFTRCARCREAAAGPRLPADLRRAISTSKAIMRRQPARAQASAAQGGARVRRSQAPANGRGSAPGNVSSRSVSVSAVRKFPAGAKGLLSLRQFTDVAGWPHVLRNHPGTGRLADILSVGEGAVRLALCRRRRYLQPAFPGIDRPF